MAPVEIVATFRLFDINRTALENLLHRFFAAAQLDITIHDRFGQPVKPREWFLVPLHVISDAIEHLQHHRLHAYIYDSSEFRLRPVRD